MDFSDIWDIKSPAQLSPSFEGFLREAIRRPTGDTSPAIRRKLNPDAPDIEAIDWHRNGSSGEGFYQVNFKAPCEQCSSTGKCPYVLGNSNNDPRFDEGERSWMKDQAKHKAGQPCTGNYCDGDGVDRACGGKGHLPMTAIVFPEHDHIAVLNRDDFPDAGSHWRGADYREYMDDAIRAHERNITYFKGERPRGVHDWGSNQPSPGAVEKANPLYKMFGPGNVGGSCPTCSPRDEYGKLTIDPDTWEPGQVPKANGQGLKTCPDCKGTATVQMPPKHYAGAQATTWIQDAQLEGFRTEAGFGCTDCGSSDGVTTWTSNVNLCGSCRASYEV